ncbi:MAG: DUF6883 domain-containing protein [Gaiellales bacterium]
MTGRHKARVFMAALGIGQRDWEYLRDQLLEGVPRSPIVGIRPEAWGVNYEVNISRDGLNGRTHPVASVWFARVMNRRGS